MGTRERRLSRERAVQALFSLDVAAPPDLPLALSRFWDSVGEDGDGGSRPFAEEIVRGVVEHRAAIDDAIQAQSSNWRVERMAKVDRNVLRVATWELLHTTTPAKVIINEAIEIAKTFGSEASPAFVNGILDRVARGAGRL